MEPEQKTPATSPAAPPGSSSSALDKDFEIPWHAAFFQAIQAELVDYKDLLSFESEHQLTTDPLRIDVVIVKKLKDAAIRKDIAEAFRRVNIIEYKSPGKSFTVDDYCKACAYVLLYKSLRKAKLEDMTLSVVVSRHPQTLFRHLRETRRFEVRKKHPGVYEVTGEAFPVQVIESKRLAEEDNLWLRNLTDRLEKGKIDRIRRMRENIGDRSDLGAYMYAVVMANQRVVKEDYSMKLIPELVETLESVGLIAQWREEGRTEGILTGRLEGHLEDAKGMFAEGDSIDKIARVTKIPVDTLKQVLRTQ